MQEPLPQLAHGHAPAEVTLAEAFRYWLKLGFISFGGPAGQIAIMHHDLVEKKRWISEQRFLHALNYCMVLPGPEAQQLATYIGWLMHRTWGGIIAGTLFVLPSFFILSGLAWIYMVHGTTPAIAGALYGIKPAVVAIVLFAAWRIGSRVLKNTVLGSIATLAFLAAFALALPFPAIVLAAALIGFAGSTVAPEYFMTGVGHEKTGHGFGKALIDDDTPAPGHAKFNWGRFVRTASIGVGLWSLMMAVLAGLYGWDQTLTQMGWFFTKAALLTFGGAYAVLPYVTHAAVDHYHWLTAAQMIDGLALGETTPGPLIMVITFVGFVGGWGQALFGPEAVLASALAAATVATFATFLPSFVLIFLGGPYIETTHGSLKLTAPLTAISAAVVGVIVNLALFFAGHVFWPQGTGQGAEFFSVGLACAAMVALFRFRLGVVPVILVSGMVGLGWKLFA